MRALLTLTLLLAGCPERARDPQEEIFDLSTSFDFGCRTARTQADILFVVADSSASAPLQQALQAGLPAFVQSFEQLGAQGETVSYHVGVITTDLGAPGIACGHDRGGKLQQVGAGAGAGCAGPVGKPYLELQPELQGGPANLPPGQDAADTLACMTQVGTEGCAFEAPLEAAYRALHDPIVENQRFLRPDAVLLVVFVTGKDDCSVDPTSVLFVNPSFGPLTSFRCTRAGVTCDGAPISDQSPLGYDTCVPTSPVFGGLTGVQKYIDFFTQPAASGGVKADPRDVVLAGVMGPASPFFTAAATGADACGDASSCLVLGHSCTSAVDASLAAEPAVRLQGVVGEAMNDSIASVCDDDHAGALADIAAGVRHARFTSVCGF